MTINLILDKTKLLDSTSSILALNEQDYFICYGAIKESIVSKKNISFISYNAPVINWLSKAFNKYPGIEIIYIEISFRELLAKKWNINYDLEISDTQIINEKLLDMQIEGGDENIPFTNFVCNNFISPLLTAQSIPKSHYGDLINHLVQYDKLSPNLPKLFKSIYSFKIKNTLGNDPTNIIYKLIDTDINEAYETISTYRILSSYPAKIKNNCLPESINKSLEEIRPNLNDLNVESYIKHSKKFTNSVLPELNIFFNNHLITDKASLKDLINLTSGLLKEEIEFILQKLKEKPELINEDIISQIESKFSKLLPIFISEIRELRDLIQPKYPNEFESAVNIDDAITWAIEEYLPYRYWMDRARKVDTKIVEYGIKFSEYYFNNYDKISYHYANCLFRYILNNKEIIKNTDVTVVLILDNFSYRHLNYLKSSFNEYKLYVRNTTPYISLLPSETGVSKFSLVSAHRDAIDSKTSGYETTIKNVWKSYFPDHKITYISRIGDLENCEVNSKEIIFINYIEIDKELHKAYEKTAREHNDIIKFYISGITSAVNKFCKGKNIEDKVKIFFASDHGSTLINKNIQNKIDIKYFKNFKLESSHRFLELEDKEYLLFKNNVNVQDSLHFLDKMISGDGTNYIIAKGYNRFIDISDEFYVHGGASPEEVIVPTGYFEYETQTTKSIIFQLQKNDYRLLVKDISIWRIANPNSESIESIFIETSIDDEILFQHSIKEIKSNNELKFNEEIRIKDENAKNIRVNISYKIVNNYYKEEFVFPITIKKIVQSKFNFDNF